MTLSPQYQRVSRRETGSRAAAHVNPRVGMLLGVEELRQDGPSVLAPCLGSVRTVYPIPYTQRYSQPTADIFTLRL